VLRALIQTATVIVTESYEDAEDVDTLLDRAEQAIFEIGQRKTTAGFVHINAILKGSFRRLEQLYERKELVTGIPTGFTDLYRQTAGLQPSDLIIIAARPGVGKTALALNIAEHVGVRVHRPVAIFSLEMSKEQLVVRFLCSQAKVDSSKLRTGFLGRDDWPPLTTPRRAGRPYLLMIRQRNQRWISGPAGAGRWSWGPGPYHRGLSATHAAGRTENRQGKFPALPVLSALPKSSMFW
jgi:replicative DNA helicase